MHRYNRGFHHADPLQVLVIERAPQALNGKYDMFREHAERGMNHATEGRLEEAASYFAEALGILRREENESATKIADLIDARFKQICSEIKADLYPVELQANAS